MQSTSILPLKMRRGDVAKLLHVSIARVRQWQAQGRLVSIRDEKGVYWFTRESVVELANERKGGSGRALVPGELAARVFAMIRDGFTLPAIVIETRESPETIRKLHADYLRGFAPKKPKDEEDESGVELRRLEQRIAARRAGEGR